MDQTARRPSRLFSIDVLRGAAALAVVFFHTTRGTLPGVGNDQSLWLLPVALPVSLGFSGVFLFFVISGFCIHLKWARQQAETGSAETDFAAFWKRRIRRLYPPYLVALSLFVFLLWMEGVPISPVGNPGWDIGLHLLMLHNLDPTTSLTINGVFWTLAIEEQLYLAYFLLLVIRRRLSWFWTLALCLAVRIGWFALAFAIHRLWGGIIVVQEAAAAHWFVWVLGAWSVEAAFGLVKRPPWTTSVTVSATCLSVAAGLSIFSRVSAHQTAVSDFIWLINDPLWGVGFFVLINRLVWFETVQNAARSLQGFAVTRWLGKVGLFSYSLYLTHELILSHYHPLVPSHLLTRPAGLLIQIGMLVLAALLLAWLFFQAFEKPFLAPSGEVSGANSIR